MFQQIYWLSKGKHTLKILKKKLGKGIKVLQKKIKILGKCK
jgi:hypothetical protein